MLKKKKMFQAHLAHFQPNHKTSHFQNSGPFVWKLTHKEYNLGTILYHNERVKDSLEDCVLIFFLNLAHLFTMLS